MSTYKRFESDNIIQSAITLKSEENRTNSYAALKASVPLKFLNPLPNQEERHDCLDNRQTLGLSTVSLPSPTLTKHLGDQLLLACPLKIMVKNATKYLGLSKSLGIKVSTAAIVTKHTVHHVQVPARS